jgi:hypothetical protein
MLVPVNLGSEIALFFPAFVVVLLRLFGIVLFRDFHLWLAVRRYHLKRNLFRDGPG